MTVRTLHLYGTLADRFGAQHEVVGTTIGEALRIVECNHAGFLNVVQRMDFHVAIGPKAEPTELLPHHMFVPRSTGDWHLVPAMDGSKSRGVKAVFSIVVGGALLLSGVGGSVVALMGAAGFLGGISQLLTPTPQTDTTEKKPTSFSFDGPGEIDDEGGPIHLILGEVITGGIRIASAIESTASASLAQFDLSNAGLKGMFGEGYALQLAQLSQA